MGIQICSNEGPRHFPMGDNRDIMKKNIKNSKYLLQKKWNNFNQTWHITTFGIRGLIFYFRNKGSSLFSQNRDTF